jgi:hypothetical protein
MWVTHPVYQNYCVSSDGQVRHINSKQVRACRLDKYGYKRFNITIDGKSKTLMIHKMVAECFVPNPYSRPTVNHKDGDKFNNKAANLEWLTAEDNVKDAFNRPHKKCIPITVDGVWYRSIRDASLKTGIHRNRLLKDN